MLKPPPIYLHYNSGTSCNNMSLPPGGYDRSFSPPPSTVGSSSSSSDPSEAITPSVSATLSAASLPLPSPNRGPPGTPPEQTSPSGLPFEVPQINVRPDTAPTGSSCTTDIKFTGTPIKVRSRPYSSTNFWAGGAGRVSPRNRANSATPTLMMSRNSTFNPEPYRFEPCATGETIQQCLNNELTKNFDKSQLKSTITETRNTRPSQQTIQREHEAFMSTRARATWKRLGTRANTQDKLTSVFLKGFKK